MKVVQINTTCGIGSTGKICTGISRLLTADGIENYILYSDVTDGYELGLQCSGKKYIKMQALKSRVLGNYGFNSYNATRKIISELKRIRPDIVHIHNIHGHDCNLELLINFLKQANMKVIWTFHDCWAFTGYCPHFMMVKCDKWRTGCYRCIQRREYSWIFDRSSQMYERKKQILEGLKLTIVTPSQWLADVVHYSFLKHYPVKVINNGIDISVFKPMKGVCKEKYGIDPKKKIVLGVAFDWGVRKGLDVFVNLARTLDNATYQIVLVGTNDVVDKQLPDNIVSIHRTQNLEELAELYSIADVFANPTREDSYPTVNMEALACGTPVVTFNTGGSPEILDKACGYVVECDDIDSFYHAIIDVCNSATYSSEACLKRSINFEKSIKFKDYIDLYKEAFDE